LNRIPNARIRTAPRPSPETSELEAISLVPYFLFAVKYPIAACTLRLPIVAKSDAASTISAYVPLPLAPRTRARITDVPSPMADVRTELRKVTELPFAMVIPLLRLFTHKKHTVPESPGIDEDVSKFPPERAGEAENVAIGT